MPALPTILLSILLLGFALPSTLAAGGGGGRSSPAKAQETPYEQGLQAIERADWPGVIEAMQAVIERQPKHDDAHNYLGYAYRKQGDYERALKHYQKALELNPHHRGAMEYLGEAYLELKQPEKAQSLLDQLAWECQRAGQQNCEEWQDLQAAVAAYRS